MTLYMESIPEDLQNARGTFAQKPILGPKMTRDHGLLMFLQIPIFWAPYESFWNCPEAHCKGLCV